MLAVMILGILCLISLWIMMWGYSPVEGNFQLMMFEVGWLDSLRSCWSTLCKGCEWCFKYVFSTPCASFCLNPSMKLQISFLGCLFIMLPTFHGKRSHPLLWTYSRTTGRKITISGIINCVNYCVIFVVHTEFTDVAADRVVQPGGPRVEDLCSKENYLDAYA